MNIHTHTQTCRCNWRNGGATGWSVWRDLTFLFSFFCSFSFLSFFPSVLLPVFSNFNLLSLSQFVLHFYFNVIDWNDSVQKKRLKNKSNGVRTIDAFSRVLVLLYRTFICSFVLLLLKSSSDSHTFLFQTLIYRNFGRKRRFSCLTDQRTDGRMDGHTLLKRCKNASKKTVNRYGLLSKSLGYYFDDLIQSNSPSFVLYMLL